MSRDAIVSFDDEPLILVDAQDGVLGYDTKVNCHEGEGILHRAFSVFLFNDEGKLLLQQRSRQKPLWPLVWSNSCCSHPRRNEESPDAARRRTREELGLTSELQFLFKFTYRAAFGDVGTEHELCSVFVGKAEGEIQVNANEINCWKFVSVEELESEMTLHPDQYSPWLKLEWAKMRSEHWPAIQRIWASRG